MFSGWCSLVTMIKRNRKTQMIEKGDLSSPSIKRGKIENNDLSLSPSIKTRLKVNIKVELMGIYVYLNTTFNVTCNNACLPSYRERVLCMPYDFVQI